MGLFEKKFCDICGEKIGLLGNRKLSDGNCCKDCAKKLSPFLTDRRQQSIAEIKEHLAYREQNKQTLKTFRPDVTLGNRTKVYIDHTSGTFAVSSSSDYRAANADVIPLSQVTNVEIKIEEDCDEIYDESGEERRSYNPPRYQYSYDFNISISVNSQWFSVIKFELSDQTPDSRFSELYYTYERQANEIRCALLPGAAPTFGQPMNGGYNQPYGQQPMNQGYNQPYGQQPMNQGYNQPYGQQPMSQGYNQPYGQQPVNQGYNQPYAQQPVNQGYNQPYGQQPVSQGYNQPYAQQPMNQGYNQQPNSSPSNAGAYISSQPSMIRCDKCGWVTTDVQNAPRFCPQCGDPINAADMA